MKPNHGWGWLLGLLAGLFGSHAGAQPITPPSVLPASNLEPAPTQNSAPIAAFPPPEVRADSNGVFDLTPAGLFESHNHGHHNHNVHHGLDEIHLPHHLHSGWFGTAEFLIWRARTDASDFVLQDPVFDLVPQGRVQNVDFRHDGGLRAGIGYRLPEEAWELAFTYTYFRNTGGRFIEAGPGGILYPTQTKPGFVDMANTASASTSLSYHLFDSDIARIWQVDRTLALRTMVGIRSAAIDMNGQYRYDGVLARFSQVDGRSQFHGAGPTAGLESRWSVIDNLELFGNFRGGLLFGEFQGETLETNANGLALLGNAYDQYTGVSPFMSFGLGGTWRWNNISVAAGYEVTHWFNAMARPRFTDDFSEGKVARNRSDLSLDGVFFRLGIGF